MRFYDNQGDTALEASARVLDASPDYRVLRRLPKLTELWLAPIPPEGPASRLACVDTETTGLTEKDRLIELAIVKLSLTADGELCDIAAPIIGLEDPGVPLTPQIRQITGLNDDLLAGQSFNASMIDDALADVDAFVCFNARFDAGFWRRRFADHRHPWICAYRDIDWSAQGHTERSQTAILAAKGFWYQAHRAAPDAWALAMLLAMQSHDGRTIAATLVDAARATDFRISASAAPYSCREALKAAGYYWNPKRKVWQIDLPSHRRDYEVEMLKALHPFIKPIVDEVDWFNRHVE